MSPWIATFPWLLDLDKTSPDAKLFPFPVFAIQCAEHGVRTRSESPLPVYNWAGCVTDAKYLHECFRTRGILKDTPSIRESHFAPVFLPHKYEC